MISFQYEMMKGIAVGVRLNSTLKAKDYMIMAI